MAAAQVQWHIALIALTISCGGVDVDGGNGSGGSSDSAPIECPPTQPSLGSTCAGDLVCNYDGMHTDCEYEGGFVINYACQDGVWKLRREGSCSGPGCPDQKPEEGTPCSIGTGCPYGEKLSCPDGTTIDLQMVCKDHVWASQGSCYSYPCPDEIPQLGDACNAEFVCDFGVEMSCANGDTISQSYTCSGNTWESWWFGSCETACPTVEPTPGAPCQGELECYYGEHGDCPNGGGIFRNFICAGTAWTDEWQGSCPGCPSDRPVVGEPCSDPAYDCYYGEHLDCDGGVIELHYVCEASAWTESSPGGCADLGSDGGAVDAGPGAPDAD